MIYGNGLLLFNLGTKVPDIEAIHQSGNRYVYVVNNPLVFTDFSGNFAVLDDIAIKYVIGLVGSEALAWLATPEGQQLIASVAEGINEGIRYTANSIKSLHDRIIAASATDESVPLPNQGAVTGDVAGAPPVDAGKQGKHVEGHNNYVEGKSTWNPGTTGVNETQQAWENGTELPDGTRVWDTGRVVGTGGQTGVRVHQDANGRIHGYPVYPGQYIPTGGAG
ncbi:hypothetical protein SDC9_131408 [bioreactor metagenome]|uniref:Bacterial toxin 50 domain-containing protein n=1 Tax=bioreactor metagenome TaxID=1076179 RepID=A0A645D555_9ZZZZ